MENNIIGREPEIQIFDKLLNTNKSEFLALYGKRRVGKTFIIREYFKTQIGFSFTGSYEEKKEVQLQNFFREYTFRTKGQKETILPQDWNTAFSYLANYLKDLTNKKQKIVVFIDELPWLDTPKSGFVKALEYFWNQHVSAMNNVLLVVCGSAASWMQKKLFKAKGGLYNRVTKRIKLHPFTLKETELFCQSKNLKLSQYQIVQIYMVMGGIPFYLNELSRGKSAIQLIDEICFSETGLLANEYEQLYASLFTSADNHIAIIETLANAPNGITRNELLKKSGLPDGGTFTRALNELIESDFVTSFKPFEKKKKDSIYRLIDLYSLFYLKFIKQNRSNQSNIWQKLSGMSSFVAWSGYAFENICFLHTEQILKSLGLNGIFSEISSWRHRGNDEMPGAQIDLLIDRKDGMINLCEVKFTQNEFVISKDYLAALRRKRTVFSHFSKTNKIVITTLITSFPAVINKYYLEEIDSEVSMEELFK